MYRASSSVKERDTAGAVAFELALQYIIVRQDRSFYTMQLLTAIFSFLFFMECFLFAWCSVLTAVLPEAVVRQMTFNSALRFSPYVALFSLLVLLWLRASKKRFAIEPGNEWILRLNRTLLEPCLGLSFDVETGKLLTDGFSTAGADGWKTFYALRYNVPNDEHSGSWGRDGEAVPISPVKPLGGTSPE